MASTQRQNDIIEVVVSMFNAAPGAAYLSDLESQYTNLGNIDALQEWLGELDLYKNRFSEDTEINADVLLDSYGLSIGTEAGDTAKGFFVDQLTAGTSIANLNKMAQDYLKSDGRDVMFDDAAKTFQNKISAAVDYSVDKGLGGADGLASLQSTISSITADVSSVESAKEKFSGMMNMFDMHHSSGSHSGSDDEEESFDFSISFLEGKTFYTVEKGTQTIETASFAQGGIATYTENTATWTESYNVNADGLISTTDNANDGGDHHTMYMRGLEEISQIGAIEIAYHEDYSYLTSNDEDVFADSMIEYWFMSESSAMDFII